MSDVSPSKPAQMVAASQQEQPKLVLPVAVEGTLADPDINTILFGRLSGPNKHSIHRHYNIMKTSSTLLQKASSYLFLLLQARKISAILK
jgi:hypothetical protein